MLDAVVSAGVIESGVSSDEVSDTGESAGAGSVAGALDYFMSFTGAISSESSQQLAS